MQRKGEERPFVFILRGFRIDIVEILDSWVEEGLGDRVQKRYFRIKGSDGNIHRIYYDEDTLEWSYVS